MKILAFDTALAGCAVAVLDTETGKCTARLRPQQRGQSETLVPLIKVVVEEAGMAFDDLDRIVTTIGPGSFTGLRIGLSAARSFALALDIPVDGVLTTECVVACFFNKNNALNGTLLCALETKREDFYVQAFSFENKALGDAVAIPAQRVLGDYKDMPLTLCGDGVIRLKDELADAWPQAWNAVEGFDLIDPAVLAQLGAARAESGMLTPPGPVYLRGADVSQPNRPGRTIAES